MKLIHERFLSRTIEIDHDIPAKDQIERVLDGESIVHQIQAPERDRVGKVRFHFEDPGLLTPPAKEMTFHDVGRHVSKTIFVVRARSRLGKDASREIGGQDFEIPPLGILRRLVERHSDGIGFFSG